MPAFVPVKRRQMRIRAVHRAEPTPTCQTRSCAVDVEGWLSATTPDGLAAKAANVYRARATMMLARKSAMRGTFVVVVTALLLAAGDVAEAAITKSEARSYAVKAVKALYMAIDSADDYWVERAEKCDRIASTLVECEFEMYFSNGGVCRDTVQIIETSRTRYRVRYPYESDCR